MSLQRSPCGSIRVNGTPCLSSRRAQDARNELFPDPLIPMICLCREFVEYRCPDKGCGTDYQSYPERFPALWVFHKGSYHERHCHDYEKGEKQDEEYRQSNPYPENTSTNLSIK